MQSSPLSALINSLGSVGGHHLRCLQASGAYEVRGCDLNADLAQRMAEHYGCAPFSSLNEALAPGPLDVAVVCAVANSHL